MLSSADIELQLLSSDICRKHLVYTSFLGCRRRGLFLIWYRTGITGWEGGGEYNQNRVSSMWPPLVSLTDAPSSLPTWPPPNSFGDCWGGNRSLQRSVGLPPPVGPLVPSTTRSAWPRVKGQLHQSIVILCVRNVCRPHTLYMTGLTVLDPKRRTSTWPVSGHSVQDQRTYN